MDPKLWTEARAIAARRDPRGADDLAQDLACALLEEGGQAERPAAWLERVGRNAAIDRRRVEQRRAALATEIEPPIAAADPETALLVRERRGLVRRALAAVLGLTIVVTQLPAGPSPMALAMADDDLVSARPKRRPVRLIARPAAATAEKTEKAPPATARPDVTTYSPVQRFDFDDDKVIADVLSPDEIPLVVVRKAEHSSLIEIRQHFVPEMVKSLEEY